MFPIFNNSWPNFILRFLSPSNHSIWLMAALFSLWLQQGSLSQKFSLLLLTGTTIVIALSASFGKLKFSANKVASLLTIFYLLSFSLYLIYQPENLNQSVILGHLVCLSILVLSHEKHFIFNADKIFATLTTIFLTSLLLNFVDGAIAFDTNDISLYLKPTAEGDLYNKPLTRGIGLLIILLSLSPQSGLLKVTGLCLLTYLILVAGGRTEILSTLITLILLKPRYFIPIILAIVTLVMTTIDLDNLDTKVIGIVRLVDTVTEGEFSSRLGLFSASIETLYDKPECLLTGCGITFFQYHNGYGLGYFPHNILLEMLLSFGLPLTLLVIVTIPLEFRGKITQTQLAVIVFSLIQMIFSGTLLNAYFLLLILSLRPKINGKTLSRSPVNY